jgi:hypothetical protein
MASIGHTYGKTTYTVDIITTEKKGKYFNTLEEHEVQEINTDNLHMIDASKDMHDSLFVTL